MIVFGEGRPDRTSIGLLLPWHPRCQVSTFNYGGKRVVLCSAPPPVLLLPRDPQCLPVQAERVDAWIQPHVATFITSGSSLVPQ